MGIAKRPPTRAERDARAARRAADLAAMKATLDVQKGERRAAALMELAAIGDVRHMNANDLKSARQKVLTIARQSGL